MGTKISTGHGTSSYERYSFWPHTTATYVWLIFGFNSAHVQIWIGMFGSSLGSTQPMLKFELGWLTRDDFCDVVIQTWQQECRGNTSLERWQNKIRCLRQFLWGWAKHMSGHYKKEKKELISMLKQLDKKSKNERLEGWEIDLKQTLKTRLVP